MEIRCNWAYQNQTAKEDLTNHAHLFVGDLSPEVTDEVLTKAFTAFGSLSDARVMWDMNSGKSRGYGFLAFRDRTDAEQAIATMNGEWLGSRAIRVNYANQKNQVSASFRSLCEVWGVGREREADEVLSLLSSAIGEWRGVEVVPEALAEEEGEEGWEEGWAEVWEELLLLDLRWEGLGWVQEDRRWEVRRCVPLHRRRSRWEDRRRWEVRRRGWERRRRWEEGAG